MANLTDIVIAELLPPPQPHGWRDALFVALAFVAMAAVAALEYGLAALLRCAFLRFVAWVERKDREANRE